MSSPQDLTEHNHQTTFLDADPGHVTSVPTLMDDTFYSGHSPELEINSFLNRKVKIASFPFDTAAPLTAQVFRPWSLYFNNSTINKKLENYAFLNAKLNLEFRINAAPSFFGCFIASYEPLVSWRPTIGVPGVGSPLIIPHSQRPHIFIDVEESSGGTMELPFLYFKNWITLSSLEEFRDMGQISLIPFTEVASTNGDVGVVDISVYAWAEDVKLSNTTQTPILQSSPAKMPSKGKKGKKKSKQIKIGKDEFEEPGPISGPASTVASIADALTDAPFIGPYARATSMLASGVGSMAKLFGYARTPVLAEPMYTRPTPFGSMADTESAENVDRLVLDTKQGTTIDSRTAGLDGTDEMTIKSIATRESYLTQFTWSSADRPDTVLWNCDVTPNLLRTRVDPVNTTAYLTPMAFAAMPFQFWRGSLKFRFKIVASMYHRGRYQVQWDPRSVHTGSIDVSAIESLATTTIDLSTERDVTITIPFAQGTSFLRTQNNLVTERFLGGTGPPITSGNNGSIRVSVGTELNTFGTAVPITILVFVSMGDDCEFAGPMELLEDLQFTPSIAQPVQAVEQSEPVNMADPHALGANAPLGGARDVCITETVGTPDHTSDIFFGERVFSFRSMLKRYNLSCSVPFTGDAIANQKITEYSSIMPRWPVGRGFDITGISTLAAGRTNYVNLTLFRYVTSAFVGMRGGMRWKVNFCGGAPTQEITVHRSSEPRSEARINSVVSYSDAGTKDFYMDRINGGVPSQAGYALTNGYTNAGLIIEAPYYSAFRFQTTDPTSTFEGYTYDSSNLDSIEFRAWKFSEEAPKKQAVNYHCATGEDFSAFFFLNVPPMYSYINTN